MSDEIEFLGRDRDGDRVWRIGSNEKVVGGRGLLTESDVRRVMATRGWVPHTLGDYTREWGPITKGKP